LIDSFIAIKWLDSEMTQGWTSVGEALSEPAAPVVSIGILLQWPTSENPYYVISRDYACELDTAGAVMKIPEAAVMDVQEYEWPEDM
jgi:hypothetical protein